MGRQRAVTGKFKYPPGRDEEKPGYDILIDKRLIFAEEGRGICSPG
jgi:hypothetical protein